jgi:type VI secretion system secreted protein Hcp
MPVQTQTPVAGTTQSNIDAFLYLEDQKGAVKGETKDKAHKDLIQVHDFSFGAAAAASVGTGTGLGAGKVMLHEFVFHVHASKASPVLFDDLCRGAHCPKATLFIRKAGGKPQDFYVWKFEDLICTGFELNCSDDIIETVSFAYAKVSVSYSPQKADGSLDSAVEASYDQKVND